MDKMLSTSVFFGVFVSIAGYEIGLLLKRKFNLALFNPLLIAIVAAAVVYILLYFRWRGYVQWSWKHVWNTIMRKK